MPAQCCKDTWKRIPEEEPVFILRGKDLFTVALIKQWLQYAEEKGVNEEKIRKVKAHLREVEAFQNIYPQRTHIPD